MEEEKVIINEKSAEDILKDMLAQEANDEMEIRRQELKVKEINCLFNLEKLKLESRKLDLEERRCSLEELKTKYDLASDLSRRSVQVSRAIGKVMVGFLPKSDKQVLEIMQASEKLAELKKSEP
jgi:hypothetical protein